VPSKTGKRNTVDSPQSIVREGWNRLSFVYRPEGRTADYFDHKLEDHREWLQPILDLGAVEGRVLDLGCGCGIPDTALLSERFEVTGVDISDVQIERAKKLVPRATFVRADMTEVDFPPDHFRAVTCLYALIHVPLEEQRGLLKKIRRWLEPHGLFLLVTGHDAWTGVERGWLGSEATMYWSHADAETYASWLVELGFEILKRSFVPEGDGGHELFLLEKR
jgi:SAM-dependent methyltransferase